MIKMNKVMEMIINKDKMNKVMQMIINKDKINKIIIVCSSSLSNQHERDASDNMNQSYKYSVLCCDRKQTKIVIL